MPGYYGKSYRRSGGYSKRKRYTRVASKAAIMYKRPSARTQQAQIYALSKKISANTKKINEARYQVAHKHSVSGPFVGTDFDVSALVAPSSWTLVWSSQEEAKGGKYTGTSMYYDLLVKPGRCERRVDITIVFASPKNQKVVLETGGGTATECNTLISNVDYTFINGIAMMNDKRFTIHKTHRMSVLPVITQEIDPTTQASTIYQNSQRENRRTGWFKNPLKVNNRLPLQTWKDINDWAVTPSQRMHMYVFHDTQPGQQPEIEATFMVKGFTSE